jgi:hypothetical protein
VKLRRALFGVSLESNKAQPQIALRHLKHSHVKRGLASERFELRHLIKEENKSYV